MKPPIVVIGAGMGGLTAAIKLAQSGFAVKIIEARASAGGLASSFEIDGFRFDSGPYILLDRQGLEWAFNQLNLDLEEHVRLRKIKQVYQVQSKDTVVLFSADLEETADLIDQQWSGSGERYRRFIDQTSRIYQRLQPVLYSGSPGLSTLIQHNALAAVPFLLRSLGSELRSYSLPEPVSRAASIWTHIAGQDEFEAPSPMALVPALIHTVGAWYPLEGIGSISAALVRTAKSSGVEILFDQTVKQIRTDNRKVKAVETSGGDLIECSALVSNHSGIGTYDELLDQTSTRIRERLRRIPLQSPGVMAYLAVRGKTDPPYLRFTLPEDGGRCRLLVTPSVLTPEIEKEGWFPARLMSPMDHETAQTGGAQAQRDYLDRIIEEEWWQHLFEEHKVLQTRIPDQWGSDFHLYRNSMNPVMTASLMRAGRLAHRSPHVKGLYLAGSSTHPGQWVSFCAISGILAANALFEDLA